MSSTHSTIKEMRVSMEYIFILTGISVSEYLKFLQVPLFATRQWVYHQPDPWHQTAGHHSVTGSRQSWHFGRQLT